MLKKWINKMLSKSKDKEIEDLRNQIAGLELHISNIEAGMDKKAIGSRFMIIQSEYMFNRTLFPATEIIHRMSGDKINLN